MSEFAHTDFESPPRDPLFALGRAILFEMDPERAHDLALCALSRAVIQNWVTRRYHTESTSVTCLGLEFSNRIGLAAGLDKNADYMDALGAFGFGHIEVGTVTPRPQAGNPRPRLFRLPQHAALINRMGFNNKGVDHLVQQVSKRQYQGKLGINIGKNATTDLSAAEHDYLYCLERVYPHADYVTVNISSPNTKGLRDLQHGEHLTRLLSALKNTQSRLATEHDKTVPIAVKIAPDMTSDELSEFCDTCIAHEIDAIITGNTTQSRTPVSKHIYAREAGGLSGAPLASLADSTLEHTVNRVQGKLPIFGVGGVSSGNAAQRKLTLGASLVQIYSGLIYHGPALVRDCIKATQ